MGNYRISLIVPIYGVERYIGKFAETALGQDSDGIQFIFVNDGTKDRSVQILQELIDERFSHLKPHSSGNGATNACHRAKPDP